MYQIFYRYKFNWMNRLLLLTLIYIEDHMQERALII